MKLSIALITAAFVAPSRVVGAPSFNDAKFNELVEKLEADAHEFAEHMELLYESRCVGALEGCADANYDHCLSELPDQTCPGGANLNVPVCGDGVTCSGRYSYVASTVRMPAFLANGPDSNPTDYQAIESICYTKGMDDYLKSKLQQDKNFWTHIGFEPRAMYFGSHSGVFRIYPGRRSESCGAYDPTIRPWYVAASSGPKNVVMVLDISGSMDKHQLGLLKEAAKRVVQTLTIGDRVAIVPFRNMTFPITDNGFMYKATEENKQILMNEIDELSAGWGTDFYRAFETAFNVLDESVPNDSTVPCNTAVLFLTDGEHTTGDYEEPDVIDLVQTRLNRTRELLGGNPVYLFTYSLSGGNGDIDEFPSQLACATENGVWNKIEYEEDIVESLSSYQKLFALGLGSNVNKDFVAWVEPYQFATGDVMGTTVSVPVYDRSKEPPLFLGVVGIDFAQAALDDALGVEGGSSAEERREEAIRRIVRRATARCPVLELTACELEAYRGEAARCSDNCTEEQLVKVEEEKCPTVSDYPRSLWANLLDKGVSYTDSVCCAVDDDQDGACAAVATTTGGNTTVTGTNGNPAGMPMWSKIVTPIGAISLLCFLVWCFRRCLCQGGPAEPLPKPIDPETMLASASAPFNPNYRPADGSSTGSDTEPRPDMPSSDPSSD